MVCTPQYNQAAQREMNQSVNSSSWRSFCAAADYNRWTITCRLGISVNITVWVNCGYIHWLLWVLKTTICDQVSGIFPLAATGKTALSGVLLSQFVLGWLLSCLLEKNHATMAQWDNGSSAFNEWIGESSISLLYVHMI